jgi:hypothetical protein
MLNLSLFRNLWWCVLPVCLAFVAAAADDASWRSKQMADWNDDDAKQVLADSPWVKTFTPTMKQSQNEGRRGGGLGGVNIGIPGIGGIGGMGGRRGGYPGGGGGYPGGGGGYPGGSSNGNGESHSNELPKVTLRWASARPVRTAELKTHDDDAPMLDDQHYAIAVYGVPDRMLVGETKKLEDQLKNHAAIRREGKKDFKPSSVEVLDRANGGIVVYLFPMTNEISREDRRLEFDATIGRMELMQSFFTEDMVLQGKLEL